MNHSKILSSISEFNPIEIEFRKAWQQGKILTQTECTHIVNQILATQNKMLGSAFPSWDKTPSIEPKILENPLRSDIFYFPNGEIIGLGKYLRYSPIFTYANSFIEIIYAVSGSCSIDIMFTENYTEQLTLAEGQICILPPYLQHAIHNDNDDCILIKISIRTSTMKQTISNIVVEDHALYDFFLYTLYENEHSSYLLFSTGSDETIRNLVLDMLVEFNIQKSYSQNALTLMLGLFFTYLQRDYSDDLIFSNSSVSGITYIPKILNYIRQNFATATVKSIAEHFSVSTSWLDRIFRDNSHSTVTETIQEMRMEHACHLLSTTNLPVQMVAEAVGYSDVTHFIRLFKKFQNITPLQYRKKMD